MVLHENFKEGNESSARLQNGESVRCCVKPFHTRAAGKDREKQQQLSLQPHSGEQVVTR